MNTKVSSLSRSKLLLLGSALFLSSMFFGGQAKAAICTWTASSSQSASNLANWDNGSGAACSSLSEFLMFSGARTSTSAVFDQTTTTGGFFLTNGYSGTVTISNGVAVTANSDVTVGSGTFVIAAGNTLNIAGNFGVSSTVNMTDGIINFTGASKAITVTTTFNMTSGTLNLSGNGTTIQGAGTILLDDVNITASTTFANNATSTGNIALTGSGRLNLTTANLSVAGNFTNNGVSISQAGGTVTMTGNNKNIAGSGNTTFYNLALNDLTSLTGNVTTTNNLTVTTNLTGTTSTEDYYLVVGGDLTAAASFQMDSGFGHGHLTMTGSGKTLTAGSAVLTLKSLTVSAGASVTSVTSAGSIQVNATTTVAGTLNAGTSSLILYGEGAGALSLSGTLNTNTSTIMFNGTAPVIPTSTYYNLTLGPSSSGSATLGGNVTSTNLTINSGSVTLALGAKSLVVSGNLNVSAGSLTQTSGTVTMTGAGNLGGAGSTLPYNLVITGTTTFQGAVTVANSVIINSGGVLNATSSLFFVGGSASVSSTPFIINGTFNPGSGTLIYSGGTYIATTTYSNLIISGENMLINGDITVNGNLDGAGSATQSTGTLYMAGNGKIFTVTNSSFYNISIATTTLASNVTSTNIFTINGTLSPASYTVNLTGTGSPFVVNGTFTPATSNVRYAGATANIAAATYYNLTLNGSTSSTITGSTTVQNTLTVSSGVLTQPGSDYLTLSGTGTPLSNTSAAFLATSTGRVNVRFTGASVNVPAAVYYNLKIDSDSATLIGNVTSSNALIISSGKTLNGGSYTIVLNTNTGSVFQNSGTFNANTSNVYYANTTANISGESYYTLTLGSGTYTLVGQATSTNSFVNGGTFSLGNYHFVSSGDTYTNSGTVTLSGSGVVKRAASDGFTVTSYISGTANGTGNTITVTITDLAANLLAASAETKTASISATPFGDMESVTLTETGAATGIFSGTIPFNITNAGASNSKVDVAGSGSVTLTYSNDYGALTGSGTSATYSGPNFSSGGTGGGGSAPSVASGAPAAIVSTGPQTTSQTINLSFSATNATHVAISEDPAFAGANWEVYATTKSFTLSNGAGEKTVYVKFRSASGVATAAYKVNVTLKSDYIPAPVVAAPVNTGKLLETVVTAPHFEVSNLDSKVVISPVKTLVYKPNNTVKYTYSYKNETGKILKVKVLRQVLDVNGKAVAKVSGSATIAKGKTFKSNTSNLLSSKLADGTYTVQIKVMDSKNVVLAENSFDVMVKRPLPPPSITANNPDSKVVITGLKVDYKPGSAVKYTYSYKNETGKPVKIKIVRQVVDVNGKVLVQVGGTRTLSKGQSFKFNATSSLSKKLAEGTYTAKVKVLDSKNVVLDENSFDFTVKK